MNQLPAPDQHAVLADWLDYWTQTHVTAIDLGLERIRPVAVQLGVLQPDATVFTVAGTNGNGSTTTLLAAIFVAAGHAVGLYQSPHIRYFNERVCVNGQPVNDQCLIDAFVQVDAARRVCGLPLSFFEATTLAAFVIFKTQRCDVWVLEVGLGGRLDAVNLLDADVAVITNIGLDHTDWLGDTIEQIAAEKAGILRAGIPLVYADPDPVPQAIVQRAQQLGCRLLHAAQDYHWQHQEDVFFYATAALTLRLPVPHLAAVNAAAAITAAMQTGIALTQAQLAVALQTAELAGRFEQRLWQGRRLILDVAHNVHGMQFFITQLQHYRAAHPDLRAVHWVFSMLQDKDIQGVVELAQPIATHWHIAVLPPNVSRAASLAQLQVALGSADQTDYPDVLAALHGAYAATDTQDLIVVCGSFHTLDAVCEVINGHDAK